MSQPTQSPGIPQAKVAGIDEILTYSGRYVTPLDLKPSQVEIMDIAHALSNQCRYSGHTRKFYSVAQHCVYASRLLEGGSKKMRLTALLHDASEAYLQDMARPLKESPEFGKGYREAEHKAEVAIAKAFDLLYPFPDAIKHVDLVLLATERRDLMPAYGFWGVTEGVSPWEYVIVPTTPKEAKTMFLAAYYNLIREEPETHR